MWVLQLLTSLVVVRRFFTQPNGARPAPRQSTLSFSTRTDGAKKEVKEEAKEEDVKPGSPSSGMYLLST